LEFIYIKTIINKFTTTKDNLKYLIPFLKNAYSWFFAAVFCIHLISIYFLNIFLGFFPLFIVLLELFIFPYIGGFLTCNIFYPDLRKFLGDKHRLFPLLLRISSFGIYFLLAVFIWFIGILNILIAPWIFTFILVKRKMGGTFEKNAKKLEDTYINTKIFGSFFLAGGLTILGGVGIMLLIIFEYVSITPLLLVILLGTFFSGYLIPTFFIILHYNRKDEKKLSKIIAYSICWFAILVLTLIFEMTLTFSLGAILLIESSTIGLALLTISDNFNEGLSEFRENFYAEKQSAPAVKVARNFIFFASIFLGYLIAKITLQEITGLYNTYSQEWLLWINESHLFWRVIFWMPRLVLEWMPAMPDLSIIAMNLLQLIVGGIVYYVFLWFFIRKYKD